MDRVLLGTSPEVEPGITSPTYRRAGNTGLFISKPNANVLSCSDGDLIFDSTTSEFIRVLDKGIDTIPTANLSLDTLGKMQIYTKFKAPLDEENATILIDWNILTPASNLNPTAYSTSWNTSFSECHAVAPVYLSVDSINLGTPESMAFGAFSGNRYGKTISAHTSVNTTIRVGYVDINFSNASINEKYVVAWTLYKTKGI
jgi:hypothetical protein